jgi:molybdenum cofactor cytidylyltransferase
MTKVACIVLAAGVSRRFGTTKQLALFHGKPLLQITIDSTNGCKADYLYLVLGYKASEIARKIQLGRAQILLNKEFRKGLSSSLHAALENLPEDCDGALFIVADQPFLGSAHLDRLISAFSRSNEKIIASSSEGEARNPVVVPRSLFASILALNGDSGAIEIVRKHPEIVTLIETEERALFDIDTKSDLDQISR